MQKQEHAFVTGFLKRAGEYGIADREAIYILQKYATAPIKPNYSTNNQINAGIAVRNANMGKTPGNAAIADSVSSGGWSKKAPAYTPTDIRVPVDRAAVLNATPGIGHFVGPPARAVSGDLPGAVLEGASTGTLFMGPSGIIPHLALGAASKARDVVRHINRRADATNAFELKNRIPQG